MTRFLLFYGMLFCLGSCLQCGGNRSLHVSDATSVTRPAWIPRPNREHPDYLYVTAVCHDQNGLQSGRRCALSSAQRQLKQELGAENVQVKGSFVEDEYSEKRGGKLDVWLLVAYPRAEIRNAEILVQNRVLLGYVCQADPPSACASEFKERIEQTVTTTGMELAPSYLPEEMMTTARKQPESVVHHAKDAEAAKLLLVGLDAEFISEMDGEFYAKGSAWFRLVDALDGKILQTFETGEVKGGHYSKEKALRKALEKALEEVSPALSTLPK